MTKEEYSEIVEYLSSNDIETIKLGIYLILGLSEFQSLDNSFEFTYKLELPITFDCKFYLLETLTKSKLLTLLEVSKEEGWKTCSKFLKLWFETQFEEYSHEEEKGGDI